MTNINDHELAAWLATQAGDVLVDVRRQGLEGRELKDAGDMAAHELLMKLLAEHRPDDAVLSEEERRGTVSRHNRTTSERVWIIDPLDGTREFSEPPRDDWAVHVALWQRSSDGGELVAGAVAQPGLGTTFHTGAPPVVPPGLVRPDPHRGQPYPASGVRAGHGGGDGCRARADGSAGRQSDGRDP